MVVCCICCCFLSQWLNVKTYRIANLSKTDIIVVPSWHNSYAPIEYFYCFSLKAIKFNGVDTTGFLRNFVVLMYLFISIDILKLKWRKESHVMEKLMDDRKVINEKLFFDGFDTFLAQFFFELAVLAYFLIFM